jgi:hypothetical protein
LEIVFLKIGLYIVFKILKLQGGHGDEEEDIMDLENNFTYNETMGYR